MARYLEGNVVELDIDGKRVKVDAVKARVNHVSGWSSDEWGRILQISFEGHRNDVGMVRFQGDSPVRAGEMIRAGVIINDYLGETGIGNAIYINLLEAGRLDYMHGYNPSTGDADKLGTLETP